MPDDFDYATDQYNEWLENRIENARLEVAAKIRLPVGTCYNCGDPVELDAYYCDSYCCEDFEKRERHAQINPS